MMQNYFAHSPNKNLKFTKLDEILEMKGSKILQNVKARWISMLNLAKRLMAKYRTLLVKMILNKIINQ
jgi:hypothetical protein